jgi:hypothetical protein
MFLVSGSGVERERAITDFIFDIKHRICFL